ncbi:hypothetical protein OOT46_08175 [Aquabacterium sp. A7-Y]|uniref:hypothetical protein n=1 Tax=Aquabacterium sp. A7-Y TaxID=1349605 RepID=UPI00223CAE6C|nr:hypothetical protein [Aquabacterium sp. A7-Y]MCW7537823.1 hypothetical protein [Aquabacterium sp. A7-Y]
MPKRPPDPPNDAHWSSMIDQCSGKVGTVARKQRRSAGGARVPHLPAPLMQGPPCQREVLRALLPMVERHLLSRRVDLLSPRDLGQYLALEWLEWHGGTLRLTDVGRNVRDQVREVSAGLSDIES